MNNKEIFDDIKTAVVDPLRHLGFQSNPACSKDEYLRVKIPLVAMSLLL